MYKKLIDFLKPNFFSWFIFFFIILLANLPYIGSIPASIMCKIGALCPNATINPVFWLTDDRHVFLLKDIPGFSLIMQIFSYQRDLEYYFEALLYFIILFSYWWIISSLIAYGIKKIKYDDNIKRRILVVITLLALILYSLLLTKSIIKEKERFNLNSANGLTLNQIDKHFCQTEEDCVLTGADPDGFATCTNKEWYEKWVSHPLAKSHVWNCILSEEEKCGCVNNKCQRIDSSKNCEAEVFSPLPNRVSLKIAKGLFTQQEDIAAEVYNNLDKEIGFDASQVNPFTTLQFEKFTSNGTVESELYTGAHCNAPTITPPDYDKIRNWPVILKPNESYKIIWSQKNLEGCIVNSTLDEGHYQMVLKYCYPKTDGCLNIYSDEFSVGSTDFFTNKQSTQIQKGDYYYYSDNRRINLDETDNMIVVQIAKDQRTKLKQFLSDFPAIHLKATLNEERGLFWLEIFANTKIEIERILQKLQQNVNVVRLIPTFLRINPGNGEVAKFIMTDEFHVKFYPSVTRNEVENMNQKYDVEILNVSKYNEYLLRVAESSKYTTLELANIYHENGLTIWSLPNFILFPMNVSWNE